MSDLRETIIDGAEYTYDTEAEYIKDGHAYCKVCNARKDGKILEIFGRKMIFK